MSDAVPLEFVRLARTSPLLAYPGKWKGQRFTDLEDGYIRMFYPDGGSKEVIKHVSGRTTRAIRQRAALIGVRSNKGGGRSGRGVKYTAAEDEIIARLYPRGGAKAVLKHLPRRCRRSIQCRAQRLGVLPLRPSPGLRNPFSERLRPDPVARSERVRRIVEDIAAEHDASFGEVIGDCRDRRVVAARWAVIRGLSEQFPRWTIGRIGRAIDRDHTTVLHAMKRMGMRHGPA